MAADTNGRRTRTTRKAYSSAVRDSIHEITALLQNILGQNLVAHIAGVKDEKRVGKWAKGANPNPRAENRLRHAYRIAWMLLEEDEEEVVRAWFIGLNPQLGEEAPADAIREERFRDVIDAAEAFLTGA